jgi:hypothetical protein
MISRISLHLPPLSCIFLRCVCLFWISYLFLYLPVSHSQLLYLSWISSCLPTLAPGSFVSLCISLGTHVIFPGSVYFSFIFLGSLTYLPRSPISSTNLLGFLCISHGSHYIFLFPPNFHFFLRVFPYFHQIFIGSPVSPMNSRISLGSLCISLRSLVSFLDLFVFIPNLTIFSRIFCISLSVILNSCIFLGYFHVSL